MAAEQAVRDPAGRLPPWLAPAFAEAAQAWRGHALLLHGAAGVGQFDLGLALATSRLCEAPPANRTGGLACGRCASCALISARSHPDLLVLVPEAQRALWDSGAGDDRETGAGASKAKPSQEIKVDAIRDVVEFAQQTASRGAVKVVLIYPAEQMNAIAANTLLKTLEEPAGGTRFVLASGHIEDLLPTVRSRCQLVRLPLPPADLSVQWLQEQGVKDAAVVLAAAGGQPQLALERAQGGWDAQTWARWPRSLAGANADSSTAMQWPLPWLVDALGKLCHDAACMSAGGSPRFFPPDAVPQGLDLHLLARWSQELARHARQAQHPLNHHVQAMALIQGAKAVLSRAKFTITPQPKPRASR
jgi:DNA polymerase-3 subunit delta'